MQDLRRQGKPPVGIIFDCDMGNDVDDVLTLAMLYGFDTKAEARVVSISTTKSNLNSAALCDAMARFYVTATWGQFASFARVLPVGMSEAGRMPEDTPLLTQILGKRAADGKPLHQRDVAKLNDTADPAALIRNALTAHHDGNAVAILAGPATNLAAVLDLRGSTALIASKVRFLTIAIGAYPDAGPEFDVKADIPSAKRLLAEWPGPIVACGPDIGEALPYPGASIEKDFTWSTAHPVVDAYQAYKQMPYDAPASSMAAALYAIRPQEGYFKLSEPGTIRVLDDGRTKFEPAADGKHKYLIFDPAQKDRILKAYTELASMKPVPRRPRFGQQDEEKKADPAKPAAPAKPPG